MRGHFHVRVLPRERPRDTVLLVISASLPCIDFAGKRVTVGEAPVQALTVKNADLDFRHVEPAGVLRRLVKDHTSQQCVRRPDSRHFLETLAEMRVEVVEHKMNAVMDLVTENTGIICPPAAQDLAEGLLLALQESPRMRGPCLKLAQGYDWERICDLAEKIYEVE